MNVSLILSLVLIDILTGFLWIPFFGLAIQGAIIIELLDVAINMILIVLCTIWLIIIQIFTDRTMVNLTANNVPMMFS